MWRVTLSTDAFCEGVCSLLLNDPPPQEAKRDRTPGFKAYEEMTIKIQQRPSLCEKRRDEPRRPTIKLYSRKPRVACYELALVTV